MHNVVRRLKPGQRVEISKINLDRVMLDRPDVSVADRILEKIVGSGYEFYHYENAMKKTVTFVRTESPVPEPFMTWVSADRLCYYDKIRDGLYQRNDVPFHKTRSESLFSIAKAVG